jgi:hypothetical protein
MISAWWIVLAASVSGMVGFLIGAMCAVASDADDSFRARFAENYAKEMEAQAGEDHSRVRYEGR